MSVNLDVAYMDVSLKNRGVSRWSLLWCESVDSTNNQLAVRARQDCPTDSVLFAEEQTCGRGRVGRHWISTPNESLTFTLLLHPVHRQRRWEEITLVTGVAMVHSLQRLGVPALLKWPNDIMILRPDGEAKVAGILCSRCITPSGPAMLVGIGVNVHSAPEKVEHGVAGSLADAQSNLSREDVAVEILAALNEWLRRWDEDDPRLREAYVDTCITLGGRVRVETAQRTIVGEAIDIDAQAKLVVQLDGELLTFGLADVTHVRVASPAAKTHDDIGIGSVKSLE